MNPALENRQPNRNSMSGRISGVMVITLVLLGLAVVGVRQQWKWRNPTDQVRWVKTSNGLRAARVPEQSPAWKAGIRAGDWLVAIGEQPVWRQHQLMHAWYAAGVGGWLRYALVHKGKLRQAWVWLTALPRHRLRYSYEELIGLLYLVIGLFVLLRRSSAHKALHFYWFCLASFVLYSFHYTGKLNGFDWILYWGIRAGRGGMDGLGDELLAHAAFALQQNGRPAGRHLGDHIEDAQHLLAFADDVLEIVALAQGALELHVFLLQLQRGNGGA